MSILTIRLPATKHQRLKDFARARGVSLNKLVEEWAAVALAQLDAENHYRLRATPVSPWVLSGRSSVADTKDLFD